MSRVVRLTEFLLARVAEDEEFAECVDRMAVFNRPRVLAECQAKRRIVGLADGIWEDASGQMIQREMAAIYADHPDYRSEWRP